MALISFGKGNTPSDFVRKAEDKPDEFDYEKYLEYLKSDRWKSIRERILERDDWHCTKCGVFESEMELQIHHYTYERIYRELDDDLITLCKRCHAIEHGKW